ncbi:MAG: hypothetical protein AAB668_02925 [Patescibacteria group bacterium]
MKLLAILIVALLAGNVIYLIRSSWRKRQGLDQWPNPSGRYYDEWMSLKDLEEDYYPWLARKMGNREPWKTWAEQAEK